MTGVYLCTPDCGDSYRQKWVAKKPKAFANDFLRISDISKFILLNTSKNRR